jgi:hypothetical protein
MIFLLVGRESQVGAHLKLLSRISRLMNNENFRNRLQAAATKDGEEFRVNPETAGDQFYPSVAIVGPTSSSTGGRFAVTWQSHSGTGFPAATGVGKSWLRLFHNNGSERRLSR